MFYAEIVHQKCWENDFWQIVPNDSVSKILSKSLYVTPFLRY